MRGNEELAGPLLEQYGYLGGDLAVQMIQGETSAQRPLFSSSSSPFSPTSTFSHIPSHFSYIFPHFRMYFTRRSFFAMGAALSNVAAAPAISGLAVSQLDAVVRNMRSVSHKRCDFSPALLKL